MATNFPTSLDALTNPTAGNSLNTAGVIHHEQHTNANDALEALEAKVGVTSSAVTTSHDYKLAQLNRGFTFMVAASDAPAKIKAAADYVCDGTADQTEINAALAALPAAGGCVKLTEGTFNIASSILVQQDSATIWGSGIGNRLAATQVGRGTFLKGATGLTTALMLVQRAANDRPVYGVTLRDFNVDGNAIGTGVDGVYFRSNQGLIDHVHSHNNTGDGIVVQGYSSWTTYDSRVNNCQTDFNTGNGLLFDTYGADVHIFGLVAYGNVANGVKIKGASNQFIGGQLYDNDRAIYFDNSGAQTQIASMKIENSAKEAIYFDATTTGISRVMISDCGFRLNCKSADNTYDVISGTGSNACAGVSITGCRFNSATGTDADLPRYGINLWNATACQGWSVVGCNFAQPYTNHWGTAPINVTGNSSPDPLIRANAGVGIYGGCGTSAITAAATSIAITHDLAYTPNAYDITITPTNNPTNTVGNWWVDTITSTQFTVNVENVPGASTWTFAWRIG